ncbi:MAG: cytochrome c [Phycisphaerae bacterium]|nr:cytochrome c [Phycisphaerae bacterium]
MNKSAMLLAIGFGLVVAISACQTGGTKKSAAFPEVPEGPGNRITHAAIGDRLHTTMTELQTSATRFWPQELEGSRAAGGQRADEAYDKAAELARRLAETAQQLPALVADAKLSDPDRRAFNAQSEALRQEALLLADAAERQDGDDMRLALHRIGDSCNACHQRFTEVAGALKEQ